VRAKILSHANTTLGKIPYGVPLGKNLLRRRAAQSPVFRTGPANLMPGQSDPAFNQMLELAKGFEPPTL
jgi:hypothetical protein